MALNVLSRPISNRPLSTRLRIAAVLTSAGIAGFAAADKAVQWRSDDGGNGHWYLLASSAEYLCWPSAHAAASRVGASLATLTDEGEQAFLLDAFVPKPYAWIGGRRLTHTGDQGSWFWIGDGMLSESLVGWAVGNPGCCAPNEYWLGLRRANTFPGLHDLAICVVDGDTGTPVTQAIFEWSADCNGDGIVDYGQILDGSLVDLDHDGVPDECQGVFTSISLLTVANVVRDSTPCPGFTNGAHYPTGEAMYGGVPFTHGPDYAYAFASHPCVNQGDTNPFVLDVPHLVTDRLHILLGAFNDANTPCDRSGPDFELVVRFDDGRDYTTALQILRDYRNHFAGPECVLSGGRSRQVWSGDGGYWLDMLSIELPDRSGRVASIEVSTPDSAWSPFVFGVTAESADCDNNGVPDHLDLLNGVPDLDGDGVPDRCQCPADLNADGVVSGADISVLLGFWGLSGEEIVGDIVPDGVVNGADLARLLGTWGDCP